MFLRSALPARTRRAALTVLCSATVLAPTVAPEAAAATTTAEAAAEQRPAPPSRAALQRALDAAVDAGAPGVLARVRDRDGTWSGAAGAADVHHKRTPSPDGRFRIGSETKTFVATVVLQLAAAGKIELDDPIGDYLPGLLPYDTPVTVRQLMQHTGGVPDYDTHLWGSARQISTKRFHTYTPEQLVTLATQDPLQFTPGTDWSYSNTDYIVLGLLAEQITGHDLRSELKHRVLRPLGLHHTTFPSTFPFILGRHARGYEALSGQSEPPTDVTVYNMSWAWSAGAIVSTTADLNRFYRALLGGRLLPPEQLHAMKNTVPMPDAAANGYGLGLMSAPGCGETLWGHNGSVPGFATNTFTTADGKRAVTISVNESMTLPVKARAAVNNVLVTEFCGRSQKASTPRLAPQRQRLPQHS